MPSVSSPKRDLLFYILAVLFGVLAGWAGAEVGDVLFTAFLVLAPCMLLGALRPVKPWRWVIIIGMLVPIAQLLAYVFMHQKPYRGQIYGALLAFLPGIAGAYGGSFMREVIDNLRYNK